ncbi:hypothetical protein K492DRAFT_235846 [Lichtheimia hyalospora FSU 10163]|nr:hypothetical protein K492DRAFT_235846 [Lichtheimia hyalospora FSU 10163]
MLKLWQLLWKRSDDRREKQHDEATSSDSMVVDDLPPLLIVKPNDDRRTRNVVKIYPQVRDASVQQSAQDNSIQELRLSLGSSAIAQPSMSSPLVAIQPSAIVAEHPQQTSDWIKPVDHSAAVLSTDAWTMLKPVEWEALGGRQEHRCVEIPLGELGVDILFGKRRHVFRIIQHKATGVLLKLQGAVLHLTGPAERIHRLLDFLDHLNAQVGPSNIDYILIRCKGPELVTKWERLDALYKSQLHTPPFDESSVVSLDELHFTLAKVKGQSSPTLIRGVVDTIYRIIDKMEKQHFVQTFTLDRIAFISNRPPNIMGISSSNPDNPISRLRTLCKAHFALYEEDMTFTQQIHMTILKSHMSGSKTELGNNRALRDILPADVLDDFFGPISIDSFHISRKIQSILTGTKRHIPYCTLKIA